MSNYVRRSRWTVSVSAVVVGVLALAHLHAADGPTQISACVNRETGRIRVVQPNDLCKKTESSLVWNVQGPAGPQGAPGLPGQTGTQGVTGLQGLQGMQGLPGQQGPQGDSAPLGDLGRIAYASNHVQLPGDIPGDQDVVILTLTPGGVAGEVAFIKLDAAFQTNVSFFTGQMSASISRDGTTDTSVQVPAAYVTYAGSSSAVTWVVSATAGMTETFRLKFRYPVDNPNCHLLNTSYPSSCSSYNVTGQMSAITAPFGAFGGKTLQ